MSEPERRIYKQTPQRELPLFIFPPKGGPTCAIAFFVCGGWVQYDEHKHFPHAAWFAGRGALCVVADVRVIERDGTTPAECVMDTRSAVRWLRTHAPEWGVPRDRIVAAGGSAGGHVSLCAAMVEGYEEPGEERSVSCIPDLACVYNPAVLPRPEEQSILPEKLAGRIGKFGGVEKMWALSPMRAIRPGLPPVLIMHGDSDEVTPLADSRLFAERMRAAGNACELVVYPGKGHGFFNYFDGTNPWYYRSLEAMDRFLTERRFLASGEIGPARLDELAHPVDLRPGDPAH